MCSPGFSILLSEFYTCLNLASPGVTRMSSSQAAPLSGDLGEPARLGEARAPEGSVAQIMKAQAARGWEGACTGEAGPGPR